MSKRYGFVLCGAGLGLGIALASSCSPSSGSTDPNAAGGKGKGGGAGSGSDASLGAGNGSGTGNGTGSTGGGIVFGGDASRRGNGDGALTSDSACGKSTMTPESITIDASIQENIHCKADAPEPLAIYIMLDNSGSMSDFNKWKNAVAAITSFVNSDTTAHGSAWTCVNDDGGTVPPPSNLPPPGAGSISVAIQYFHPQGVNNPNECDGTGHATPDVPMAPLPGNAQAIIDSLGNTGPGGNTPTTGALTGGTQYCASYQLANPGKKCVVVLVTDGQPNGCGLSDNCPLPDGGTRNNCVDANSARVLTPIAGDAFNSSNSVMTFTVGMQGITPEGFVLLNTIAQFGGSDCTPGTPGDEACNVTTGGSQAFLDALNTIRHTVQVTGTSTQTYATTRTIQTTLACEWLIPKPDPGQEFDKGHVNVKVGNAGIAGGTLGNVATASDCASTGDGWYYDNPDQPTKIVTCPDTCTKLKASTNADVQLLVGCITQPAIFH